jgi:hypothetical protein
MNTSLDHEKLNVYQASLRFIAWTVPLLDKSVGGASVHNQLDRASTSVPLNIAEGNGKFTSPDRCRFFDIARGKTILVQIVSMLFGLIRANSDVRVFEPPPSYQSDKE